MLLAESESNSNSAIPAEYLSYFVQRHPKYAVKQPGKTWKTKNKSLADPAIKAHLRGQYAVATVAPWYPSFGVIDIDDAPIDKVAYIREAIGLNEANSMVCRSENLNSYHVYFRPVYNDKPPTVRLLNDVFTPWAARRAVEIYPKAAKCFRLPFSPADTPMYNHGGLTTVEEKLYWFNKLDEYELAEAPTDQQTVLPFQIEPLRVYANTYKRGLDYLEHGLDSPSSRHEAQFCVLYALWRMNIDIQDAMVMCFRWIRTKHNGLSKEIKRNPARVQKEIMRQAERIWNDYDLARVYPDAIHNLHHGYLTKPDIEAIIRICEGNLPRMKFLGELVRYINPRQEREAVNVHTDRLISWSSYTNYRRFLDELSGKGIIERSGSYQVGKAAKTIKLKWEFQPVQKAVTGDKRTLGILEAIPSSFTAEELRYKLKETGKERTAIIKTVKAIFEPKVRCEKIENIYNSYGLSRDELLLH
ncbi:Hypothetical protein LUCI_3730 [Lucifera butyrica]|uniref:Uncharacterized protein n=1 Tax=Lucifera butyrica TaxID=1351585 RepID=A0A498RH46_9FIRM|nr:hypothetical protein [Lucifera butyrica]VBB08458.1 Hypothetical protein LUCI_3730 [Lucifera butyrica]